MENENKKTARQMLDQIDEFLSVGDGEAGSVWSVLTALRGPDSVAYEEKRGMTVPIRRAAFPQTAAAHDRQDGDIFLADYGHEDSVYDPEAHGEEPPHWHFRSHADNAASILGINSNRFDEDRDF